MPSLGKALRMAAVGVAMLMLFSPSIDRIVEATHSGSSRRANPSFETMTSDTQKANDATPVTADGNGGMNPNALPFAGSRHAMAYDSQSDRTLLFGGNTGVHRDETWAYDIETNTWTNMNPATRPSGRYGHSMAYDSQSDRVVLFGGWTGSDSNETWVYDLNTNTWTNMTRPPDTRPPTSAILSHADAAAVTSRTATVTGTASDDVAVEKVELSLDGVTWVVAAGTTSWSGTLTLAEGANTIRTRATDTSANAATATVSVKMQLPSGPGEAPPPDIGVFVAALAIVTAVTIGAALLFRRRKRARREG